MKTSLMAGASRFAHFAGLARSSRRAAEDDDRRDDDTDGEDDKDASEDDGDDEAEPKPDTNKGRKGKKGRADADDDDKDASEDDGDDDGKDASEDDDSDTDKDAEDDDEDEMKGKGAVAQARRRERARVAHILGSKAAAANPVLAVSLACETSMTRKEAVAVLRSTPAASAAEPVNRHARSNRQARNADLGSDSQPLKGKQAVDASWGAAFTKAGIKPLR